MSICPMEALVGFLFDLRNRGKFHKLPRAAEIIEALQPCGIILDRLRQPLADMAGLNVSAKHAPIFCVRSCFLEQATERQV